MKLNLLWLSVVAAAIYGLPTPSVAADATAGYRCTGTLSPEHLTKAMQAKNAVRSTPFDTTDGIPAFQANPNTTAFGFPMIAFTAWQADSDLFGRGPGTAPPTQIALIIRAKPFEVAANMRAKGIPFITDQQPSHSYPVTRVEAYNSRFQGPLPTGSDKSLSYTKVTCSPRP